MPNESPTKPLQPNQRHRELAAYWRARFAKLLAEYPASGDIRETYVHRLLRASVEGVIRDLDASIAGVCPENPEALRGAPIGAYHCPYCGCMVVAGFNLHPHDDGCWLGLA
jgi:hypothetical protein